MISKEECKVFRHKRASSPSSCSTQFIEKLTNQHEILALDEFGHVDFYYKPEAVEVATNAVAEFFNK